MASTAQAKVIPTGCPPTSRDLTTKQRKYKLSYLLDLFHHIDSSQVERNEAGSNLTRKLPVLLETKTRGRSKAKVTWKVLGERARLACSYTDAVCFSSGGAETAVAELEEGIP